MSGPINPDTITFDAPASFTDGSSLPANAIARYEYGFSQSPTGPFANIKQDTDFSPTPQGKQTFDLDLAGFAFGQWYGAARTVTTVAQGGMTSAWSNVAPFEVRAKEPSPPTGFLIA